MGLWGILRFWGGKRISTEYGTAFGSWLMNLHAATKNSDLAAHFFRRTGGLLGRHGTLGLISTNTLSQGDTRRDGLAALLRAGFRIFDVELDRPWPGDAAVTVHVVWLAIGNPSGGLQPEFNGVPVQVINSRLRPKPERDDPISLRANAGSSFNGVFTRGSGFVLENEEAQTWYSKLNTEERGRVHPYLGGDEVNTSPTGAPDRVVVDVSDLEEPRLDDFPNLKELVEERVKPYRLSLGNSPDDREHKKFWWCFARSRPELRAAISRLSRCLVTARVSKHLMLSFQPVDRVFSEQLYVFPLESGSSFAVLQSRVHESWARFLSSTFGTGLRYAASDCFDSFPFPEPDPSTVIPDVEVIGENLYQARVTHMCNTNQGLTTVYNALKDPNCTDSRILELRALHEEMDRAVLRAYPKLLGVGSDDPSVVGWSDILVPPFCIASEEDKAALQAFEDEVIDRLFVLNSLRAKEEQAGASPKNGKGTKKTKPKNTKKRKETDGNDQGALF